VIDVVEISLVVRALLGKHACPALCGSFTGSEDSYLVPAAIADEAKTIDVATIIPFKLFFADFDSDTHNKSPPNASKPYLTT
jgi:hypothetical protein